MGAEVLDPICLDECSTTDQTAQSLRVSRLTFPDFETDRNSRPSLDLAHPPTPVKSVQSLRKKEFRLVLRVALSVLAGKAKGRLAAGALISGVFSVKFSCFVLDRGAEWRCDGRRYSRYGCAFTPAFGRAEPTHRKGAMNGAPDVWATSRTTDQVYFGGNRPGESEKCV